MRIYLGGFVEVEDVSAGQAGADLRDVPRMKRAQGGDLSSGDGSGGVRDDGEEPGLVGDTGDRQHDGVRGHLEKAGAEGGDGGALLVLGGAVSSGVAEVGLPVLVGELPETAARAYAAPTAAEHRVWEAAEHGSRRKRPWCAPRPVSWRRHRERPPRQAVTASIGGQAPWSRQATDCSRSIDLLRSIDHACEWPPAGHASVEARMR